jgi:D-sedoheptulose 7-phosphate isomerase
MTKTVFTNGCFDILHPGHVDLLRRARKLGDRLVIGINSDESVRSVKGNGRPFITQDDRKSLLESLRDVDQVIIFEELTPENLIRRIKPDILVKGGDWNEDEIIGAEFVRSNGGEVHSLPLVDGHSSTNIVQKVRSMNGIIDGVGRPFDPIDEHIEVLTKMKNLLAGDIQRAAELIIETFHGGSKVLIFGNGGSAADAQHLAAEFVGRYESERRSLPAIALTTDTSAVTAISNDYGFDSVFTRQLSGLASTGDCVVAISTSGNSPNVISAVMKARSMGCRVIGMTGKNGKKLSSLSDVSIMIPSSRTARIQEAHITVAHIWCELIDRAFSD